jgi:hypothetical protein
MKQKSQLCSPPQQYAISGQGEGARAYKRGCKASSRKR